MSTKKLFSTFVFLTSGTIYSTPIADFPGVNVIPSYSTHTSSGSMTDSEYASQFPGVRFIAPTYASPIIQNNCASVASSSSSSTPAVVNLVAPVAPSANVPVAALTIILRNRSRSVSEATQTSQTDNTPATSLRRTRSLLNQLCLLEESRNDQSSHSHIKIQA